MRMWDAILLMVVAMCICAVGIVFTIEYQATQRKALEKGYVNYQRQGWELAK